jgi:hypothetical protein
MSRVCACGCGPLPDDMRSDAIWRSRACAVAWARENPGKSLYDARRANVARTPNPSGAQVSASKMTLRLEDLLIRLNVPPALARVKAEGCVRAALPARQRELLAQRSKEAA